MTILIDIRPLMDAQYSGVSEYVYRLLQAIFSIDKKNQYILFCNAAHNVAKRLPNFNQENVKIVTKHVPNKIFNYAMLWPFSRPRFDKLVNEKVDIFFMPHLHFAAFSSGIKSVLTVHDLSFLVDKSFFSWRKNFWHCFVNVKKLTKKFSTIVAVSENTKRDLMAFCNLSEEKIKVIHSGIDQAFFNNEINPEKISELKNRYQLNKPFILFLSTLEPRKNVEALVKAFEIIKEKNNSDLELVLAGACGWKFKPILKRIKSSKYFKDIKLIDYVVAEDRQALYKLAQVLAYPSFYEGFGFPPLEAMALGTPVVAANVSSIPEITGDAAILVDPYNPLSLALALEQVLEDEKLRENLIIQGKNHSLNYTWDRAARAYLGLFEEIISKE